MVWHFGGYISVDNKTVWLQYVTGSAISFWFDRFAVEEEIGERSSQNKRHSQQYFDIPLQQQAPPLCWYPSKYYQKTVNENRGQTTIVNGFDFQ